MLGRCGLVIDVFRGQTHHKSYGLSELIELLETRLPYTGLSEQCRIGRSERNNLPWSYFDAVIELRWVEWLELDREKPVPILGKI